jgi:hypothetical protein
MRATGTRAALAAAIALSAACSAASAGLIARYTFNESSGTTAFDTAGSVNGALQGTASFVSGGISGNAVSLSSAGEGVVNMGTNFAFLTGPFTISFWAKTTTTEADSVMLSKHAAGSQNGYLVPVGPTGGGGAAGKANFTASTFVSQGVTSTTTVNDGVWHHIVAVYNPPPGTHSIYVDGAPAEDTKSSATMVGNVSNFLVGGVGQVGNPTVNDGRYTGLIDELQIYDTALTDGTIAFMTQNPGAVAPEPASLTALAGGLLALRRRRRA